MVEISFDAISSLTISGVWLKKRGLKKTFFPTLKQRLKTPQVRRPNLATKLFKSIDSSDREGLEAVVALGMCSTRGTNRTIISGGQ